MVFGHSLALDFGNGSGGVGPGYATQINTYAQFTIPWDESVVAVLVVGKFIQTFCGVVRFNSISVR